MKNKKSSRLLVRRKINVEGLGKDKVTNASEKIACKVLGRKQKELVWHRLIPEHQCAPSFF